MSYVEECQKPGCGYYRDSGCHKTPCPAGEACASAAEHHEFVPVSIEVKVEELEKDIQRLRKALRDWVWE